MNFKQTVSTKQPVKLQKVGEGRFNAHLATYANGWQAVVKHDIKKGVFRQLPTKDAHLREAAFYELSKLFYPGVVPETYVGKVQDKVCSIQMFVPGIHPRAYDKHLFNHEREDFRENFKLVLYKAVPKEAWKRLTLLDLIANSRDRHGKNVLIRPGNSIPFAAIDNGFSLGKTFRSYRNVFHRYLFDYRLYAPTMLRELSKIDGKDVRDAITPYLNRVYAENVMRRIEWVLEYPHRLPWRIISKGTTRAVEFPSYKHFFSSQYSKFPQEALIIRAA